MKLGISTYAYTWSIGFPGAEPVCPMTAVDLLAKAHELGIMVVQIGPNLPIDQLSERELEAVVQQAREWGIELELGTRGLEPKHLVHWISLAKQVGARFLRTTPEVTGGRLPELSVLLRNLNAVIPELAGQSVKLGIENGQIPASQIAGVLDELGSPWVGVTLDTVNSLAIPEGTEHVVQTLARYTVCLHVKEFVVQRMWHMMGFTVEGRPVGKGQLNVPWLLEKLSDVGVSPNAVLEVWPPQQKTLEETIALEQAWVIESVQALRRYIAG